MQATELKSEFSFKKDCGPDTVPALAHARISASSRSLNWRGLYLEAGSSVGCEADNLMVDGHFIGLQVNERPIRIQTRANGLWRETSMPSCSLCLHPEGTPFSIRHSVESHWIGAVIDGKFLDSIIGCHYELDPCYAIQDEVLSHQLQSLIGLVRQNTTESVTDPILSASLIRNFVLLLGKRYGKPATELAASGGITPQQLMSLLQWVEKNLGEDISVPDMAAHTGLSVAHFSREFKRLTGSTPWAYVMRLRVADACKRLQKGQPASSVAAECGFADQPHMSRAMKAELGFSPRRKRN